jgi:hypothetical protein
MQANTAQPSCWPRWPSGVTISKLPRYCSVVFSSTGMQYGRIAAGRQYRHHHYHRDCSAELAARHQCGYVRRLPDKGASFLLVLLQCRYISRLPSAGTLYSCP